MKKFLSILIFMTCMLSIGTGLNVHAINWYDYYKNCSPNNYEKELKNWYKRWMKKDLNLENPQTFNEKIQWLKLYDSTPIKTQLADKYLVRDYIKEKIGEEYLVPLLGAWDKFDDIDFDKLPDKFVLKCNHGSGWNIIVTDKNNFDRAEAKKKMDTWMQKNFAFCAGFELHYKNIKPKIIAEKFIEGEMHDYRILCFNGEPKIVWDDKDVVDRTKHSRNIYDTEWNLLPVGLVYPRRNLPDNKPKYLVQILECT